MCEGQQILEWTFILGRTNFHHSLPAAPDQAITALLTGCLFSQCTLNAPISIKVIRSPKPQWRWTMSPARDLRCRRICLSSCGPKFQVCFSTDMKFLLVKSQHGTSNGCKNDLVVLTYLEIVLKPTNFGPVHGGLNYSVSATHVLNQKSPKMDGANNFHKTFSAHCNGTVMNWTACARFAHTCANT